MQIIKATPKELDRLLAAKKLELPIEQSFVWQEFDHKVPGRKPLGVFFIKSKTDEIIAVAALTLYVQRGYCWVWVKHGPYFINQEPSEDEVTETLKTLADYVKNTVKGVAFIRVTTPKGRISLKSPIHHTMYDKTIIVDINKSDDELLASMTRSGRYDVRKSIKAGLTFKIIPANTAIKEFDTYYAILNETAKRDGFRPNTQQTYLQMLKSLGQHVSLFAAFQGDKPVAWAIATHYAGKGVYYYAASNSLGRQLCASYGLQYFVMCNLRDKKCDKYDMMGIGSDTYPDLANVTGFKKKFSSNIVDINKTYDIPLSPRYVAVKLAKKLKEVTDK